MMIASSCKYVKFLYDLVVNDRQKVDVFVPKDNFCLVFCVEFATAAAASFKVCGSGRTDAFQVGQVVENDGDA